MKWLSSKIKWSEEQGVTGEFDPKKLPHDVVISGSDQIWNPKYETSDFFLQPDFPDRIKKVAYAASFGTDKFIEDRKPFFKKYMSRFSAISMRESSAAETRGSLFETLTQLELAKRLQYISNYDAIRLLADEISRMLTSMLQKYGTLEQKTKPPLSTTFLLSSRPTTPPPPHLYFLSSHPCLKSHSSSQPTNVASSMK